MGSDGGWTWADMEVARPSARHCRPGITMAGFRQRVSAPWDITMVAHPAVTVLVDLSREGGAAYRTGGHERRGSVAAGLLPGSLRATGWGGVDCLQIRLEPTAAAAMFGPAAELTGTVVAFADLWGRGAGQAEERLRDAASWDERFTIAAQLLDRRPPARHVDPEVARVWRRMRDGRGRSRVDGLAAEVGWSRQRLWSRFRSQVGLSPKQAARLVRFDHAAHLLAAGHPAAAVAAGSGYVDQSHLHREVGAFTGLTPAAVAGAPWLAVDDVAWPAPKRPGRGAGRPAAGAAHGRSPRST